MLLSVAEKPGKQDGYACQHMYEIETPKHRQQRVSDLEDVVVVMPWL